jgi:formyltetrahydrofolate-dependent phosphoribosylglycinamide formyltransferase
MTSRLRLAILISGRGSNMVSLLQAARDPAYPAEPVLVLSNRPDAAGLIRAQEAGIATLAIDHKTFRGNRESFDTALTTALEEARADIIALAGFMRVLTPGFVSRWAGRLINIHPSLLPKYPGLDTHQRALAAGDTEAGCTVHHVTAGVDEGPVIAQACVPIVFGDTPESLAARVLRAEHRLYPAALAMACDALAGV